MSRLVATAPSANVVWFDAVDSTNAVAERLVEAWLAGEEHGVPETVVVACRQTSGRGRGGHGWESPPGGLYATWVAAVSIEALPAIPMAVGVSLATVIEEMSPGVRIGLKWPNDLQVAERKLGGVLCTSRSTTDSAVVVAGFGINVDSEPALPPGDPTAPISLRGIGFEGNTDAAIWSLVGGFLAHIHPAVDDRDGTRALWAARSVHRVGERLRLRVDGGVVEGLLVGFGRDGELELDVRGQRRRFAAGRIVAPEGRGG